ncbi:MAG: NAD-binding protein, partial [Pseudomonadota bacterium]
GEALVVSKMAGMDMNTAYEAIRISSGNSFVHETESQVILNGSYDINFTMDLVKKDMGLFADIAKREGCDLELSPAVFGIFEDAAAKFGERAWSSMVVKHLEDHAGVAIRGMGFPAQMKDDEEEVPGAEVMVRR